MNDTHSNGDSKTELAANSNSETNANEANASEAPLNFENLGLSEQVLRAVQKVGYETPSAIQAQCIPIIQKGKDIIGQAQTGTGKTAAFALPVLSNIDEGNHTQVLILTPTRELAIQVAEACQTYSQFIRGCNVDAIYGGQGYTQQLRQLKKGLQVVVGTPGRVMDHMRKGSLKLDQLSTLVLDEADEMLRMGFIDDVKWVLEHLPATCQKALFSATMPNEIREVAKSHLKKPDTIKIASKTATASTITQRYLILGNREKTDVLVRLLQVESYDGLIVFVRTKTATVDLAQALTKAGFKAEALNGDIPQNQRERIVDKLKSGQIDILIATDVVARGLDVERISHVVNYDIPYDNESYVHRIGRTGRAGRTGDAILFITAREKRLLQSIERTTKQKITRMDIPGSDEINTARINRFKTSIDGMMKSKKLDEYKQILAQHAEENNADVLDLAAALALMTQNGRSLTQDLPELNHRKRDDRDSRDDREPRERSPRKTAAISKKAVPLKDHPDIEMQRYVIALGYNDDIKPGNIVGAIANEADLESQYIGNIEIHDNLSTVDLPSDMPKDLLEHLGKSSINQKPMSIHPITDEDMEALKQSSGRRPQQRRRRSGNDFKDRDRKPRGDKRSSGKPRHRKGDGDNKGGNSKPRKKPKSGNV